MKLVVMVLNREELLERVLEAYVEAGIDGATIVDSEGMGRFLTYEVPLFAHLRSFMKGNKPYNKTILSVVRDDALVPRLVELIDEVCGGFSEPGTGILFTVPVDFAVGLIGSPEPTHPPAAADAPAAPGGPPSDSTDDADEGDV